MNRTILSQRTFATSLARQARRSINTSSAVKAAAGHDDHHGHGHAAGPEDPNVYTKECESRKPYIVPGGSPG